MKKQLLASSLALALGFAASNVHAADYAIDTAHSSVIFKIQHLGYSWLYGSFDEFSGEFSYDNADSSASSIMVNINPNSINSNHAERDKHLKSGDFLDVSKFKEASFKSTSFEQKEDGMAVLMGDLTIRGISKSVTIDVSKIGEGKDPWGGERVGFAGETKFKLTDFDIPMNLGPASEEVTIILNVEGVKK
ncbi:YceI family protein [Alginatibacterium sediminis]|uniref:YceI family protein n=1 Tax=Alginatibacterium sediminis TaxID=2164068 RepID=A0A420ECT0_9ALTE|nr:YceI family protein [Alginatibacterium sediminis]RKF18478.1 YceI family protein [Alginatibacterium sediminis]